MVHKNYTDEFKLQVVKDYLKSSLGIRSIAKKYGLPSKNYITRWRDDFIKKGLISSDKKDLSKTQKESINNKR